MGVWSDPAELVAEEGGCGGLGPPVCCRPSSFSSDSLIAAATARSASGAIAETESASFTRICDADAGKGAAATADFASAAVVFVRDSDASPSSDGAPSTSHCSNDDRAELS